MNFEFQKVTPTNGEEVCCNCKSTGFVVLDEKKMQELDYRSHYRTRLLICPNCYGYGTIDWIEKITKLPRKEGYHNKCGQRFFVILENNIKRAINTFLYLDYLVKEKIIYKWKKCDVIPSSSIEVIVHLMDLHQSTCIGFCYRWSSTFFDVWRENNGR